MNKRIKQLAEQADLIQWDTLPSGARTPDHESVVKAKKFAELIIQDCANFVRKDYDHKAAETIAWNMEIEYGLHGDYA